MGVLDDAIREHIELQRAHGASEEELRRQEREALGPPRRESPEQGGAEEAAAEVAEGEEPAAASDEFDRQRTRVLPQTDLEDSHAAPASDAEPGLVVGGEPDLSADAEGDFAPDGPPVADEPAPFDPLAPSDPFAGDEPFADPAEAEEDEVVDGEMVEEDVLEETPEFLQETPEHDRLWFEQKPPRDFDFDDK